MTPNDHVKQYLDWYFKESNHPGFAVMLSGEWGVGKTHFAKTYMGAWNKSNGSIDKGPYIVYVSLYHVQSYMDIEHAIFTELYPSMRSGRRDTAVKALTKSASNLTKLNIDWSDIKSILSDRNDIHIIFDDLERSITDPLKLLSFINSYVEHKGLKAVILANEDAIDSQGYIEKKEKVVGRSIKLVPDWDSALAIFYDQAPRSVKSYGDIVKDVFEKAGHNNLRHVYQTLLDLGFFLQNVIPLADEKYSKQRDFMIHLVRVFFSFSVELKAGKLRAPDLHALSSISIKAYHNRTRSEVVDEAGVRVENFLKKYDINVYDMIFSARFWHRVLVGSQYTPVELENEIVASRYFRFTKQPEWVRLWHFRDLNDDEYDTVFNSVRELVAQRFYTRPEEILHIFGLLYFLNSVGLDRNHFPDIVADVEEYLSDVVLQIPETQRWVDQSDAFGFEYHGNQLPLFLELVNRIDRAITIRRHDMVSLRIEEILSAVPHSTQVLRNYLVADEYLMLPILAAMDIEIFFSMYVKLGHIEMDQVLIALYERWRKLMNLTASREQQAEMGIDNLDEMWITQELSFVKSFLDRVGLEVQRRKGRVSGLVLHEVLQYWDRLNTGR